MVQAVWCPRDPSVETALRCGKCDTPICPKCLVQSPVGARCKDCAKVYKSPIYTLSPKKLALAITAAIIGGIAMGVVWILVLLPFTFGFISIFVGAGLGWVFTQLMDFVTGKRRGTGVVLCAAGGIILAWSMQLLVLDFRDAAPGLLVVGIGIYWAYYRLSRV